MRLPISRIARLIVPLLVVGCLSGESSLTAAGSRPSQTSAAMPNAAQGAARNIPNCSILTRHAFKSYVGVVRICYRGVILLLSQSENLN